MPGPKTGHCGGVGEPACPPVPTIGTNDTPLYTYLEMAAHGEANYLKGRVDERMIPHPADDGPK